MSGKNKAAFKIIILIIFFNVATKFLGFYRDAVIGRSLGAQLESDAYFMALSATTLIFLAISSGISTTTIPIIVKEKDKKRRQEIVSNILNIIILISLCMMAVYFFATDIIVKIFAGGFTGEQFELTVNLTKMLLPTAIFINIAYLFVGVLQSNEKYLLPTLISLPYNIIILIYLFFFVDDYGVIGLAVITVVGWALQMLIQIPTIVKLKELKYNFKIDFKAEESKVFLGGIVPVAFVMATTQLAIVTDNSAISYFGNGKVTTVYFGNMLFVAIVTIIVYGITAVMFPKFNKSYIEDKQSFYTIITKVLQGVILLLVPVGVGVALLSNDLISFIYLSDKFTIESVNLTANFLKIYCTFMVAFGIIDIMNKGYYTKGDRKTPVKISIIILTANVILNFVYTKMLNFGIYSIVFATSVSFYLGAIVSLYLFKSDDGNIQYKNVFTTLFKVIISAFVMFIAITAMQNNIEFLKNTNTNIDRLLSMAICTVIGIVVYGSSLIILKEKNIIDFLKGILKKKGNKNER